MRRTQGVPQFFSALFVFSRGHREKPAALRDCVAGGACLGNPYV
jgi:hypothetical protein